jgi:O-antigen ligase
MNRFAENLYPLEKNPAHSLEAVCLYIAILFMPMKRGASLGWLGLPWGLTLFKVFAIAAFVIWICRSLLTKSPRFFSFPIGRMVAIGAFFYLAFSVLSVVNSMDIDASLSFLLRRSLVIVFFVTFIGIINDKRTLRIMLIVFLFGLSIECLAGVYELIAKEPIINATEVFKETVRESEALHQVGRKVRIQGFALDPDWHVYFIIIGMGVAVAALFSNYLVKTKKARLLLFVLLILMVVNILASASRAGWIALFISLCFFLVFAKIRNKGFVIIGTIALSGVLFSGLLAFTDTLIWDRLTGKTGSWSVSLRMEEVKLSMTTFRAHPIIGVGPGNSTKVRHRYAKSASVPDLDVVTNGYMVILSENGLIGLTAYLFVLASFMAVLVKMNRKSMETSEKVFAVGLLSSLLAHFFLLFFYPVPDSEFFWFILGIGCVAAYLIKKEETSGQEVAEFIHVPFPQRQ